ncbi:MAG: DUF6265 family protein [Planctomycetota bacterium]|jgi:hypothetical protein
MLRTTLLGLLLLTACQTTAAPTDPEWQPVAFMTGAWRSLDDDGGSSLEVWTSPHGLTMYGQNRTIARGQLVFFELLGIEKRGDTFVYVARPRGADATEFVMTSHGENSATFVNNDHDFPKRIHYQLSPEGDELRATADANDSGGQRLEYRWTRVR